MNSSGILSGVFLAVLTAVLGAALWKMYGNFKTEQARQSQRLVDILAQPDSAPYVWFVTYDDRGSIFGRLYVRDVNGNPEVLAAHRDIFHVWHKLQRAGVMVHDAPPA